MIAVAASPAFQLTGEQWANFCTSYWMWNESQWRNVSGAGYHLNRDRELEIIKLIYSGLGHRQIFSTLTKKPGKATISRTGKHVRLFCATHPAFPFPKCRCGNGFWHHGACDATHPNLVSARRKGHITQARLAQERYVLSFFQTIEHAKSMTTIAIQPTKEKALQFSSLIQQGIDAWTEAGKLLVQMIAENPDAKQEIIEACPDITEEILARFEAIGRNQLHPRTLLNSSPGMRRLRMLPYSDQARYLETPVELLIKTDSGVETMKVPVKNLTAKQSQQVFSPAGVRSAGAQRVWLESREVKEPPATNGTYRIKGDRIIFTQPCEMRARELAHILAQMS